MRSTNQLTYKTVGWYRIICNLIIIIIIIIINDIIKVELHIEWHVSIHGWFQKNPPSFLYFCKIIITIIIIIIIIIILDKFDASVIGVPITMVLKPPLQGI